MAVYCPWLGATVETLTEGYRHCFRLADFRSSPGAQGPAAPQGDTVILLEYAVIDSLTAAH